MVVVKIGAETMVMVQHGGDAVKPEAIKMIFRHPELQVAQQEVNHAGLTVIKALGSPGGMVPLGAVVEKLPGRTVEHIDSFGGILHRVGMDHIQKHPDPHGMGGVYKIFQVLGSAEPTGRGKEIGHLIAEASIIGMLHNGHELYGIVTIGLDTRQDLIGKFPVGPDLALLLGHAHMGFVYIQRILSTKITVGPGILLFIIGDLSAPGNGFGILHHPAGIQRDVLRALHIGIHHRLNTAALPEGIFSLKK